MKKLNYICKFLCIYSFIFGISFYCGTYYYNRAEKKSCIHNDISCNECIVGDMEPAKTVNTIPQTIEGEESVYFKNKHKQVPLYPKEVFLTFDDGPSINNTSRILNILLENNVKATFFVVGKKAEENPEILKKVQESGMYILAHSYSHDYKIYKSNNAYIEDLEQCNKVIKTIIGKEYPYYTRLPGGSTNLSAGKIRNRNIRDILIEKGINYVDWNVSSADAANEIVPAEKIKSNVISQCKNKNLSVVLMHDSYYKTTTVEALPDIIKFLKTQGFVFRTFDDITDAEEKEMIKLKIMNR